MMQPGFANGVPVGSICVVTQFTRLIALTLLALWVPVTSHCLLESLPGFGFLACCQHQDAAPHQDADCDQDACAVVESGSYMIQENPPLSAPPVVMPVAFVSSWLAEPALIPISPIPAAALAPPELSQGWQFSARTALLLRAPSFVS